MRKKTSKMTGSGLIAERGEVVEIGSLKILPSQSLPCRIPILSFLVFKKSPQDFTATCFQLLIDGTGSTPEEAEVNLKERCGKYFRSIFSAKKEGDDAWNELSLRFKANKRKNELRDLYYYTQFEFAKEGANADFEDELAERIKNLEDKLSNLNDEKKMAELPTEEIPDDIDLEIVGVMSRLSRP